MTTPNPVAEKPHAWVAVADAARYAGVGRKRIVRACRDGRLPERFDGRRRLVPLELVLLRLGPNDLDGFRRNLERAASMVDAPDVTREWWRLMNDVLTPLLDDLDDARRRAALAEAQLDLLRASSPGAAPRPPDPPWP